MAPVTCPIKLSLDRVGDCWSMLILREALNGVTRFDLFEKRLGIAPNMLTRRLTTLVADGLMEKRAYQRHPPRHDYLLTPLGRDFLPVLVTLMDWGNRHFAADGIVSELVDASTGAPVEAVLVDKASGRPIDLDRFRFAAGPAASEAYRTHMAAMNARRTADPSPARDKRISA